MQVGDFLSAVLPGTGNWFVTLITETGVPVQRAFSCHQKDDLVKFATWGVRKGWDAYFGVSAFGTMVRQTQNHEMVLARTADNSIAHRCLRLDIDCGEGKAYPTHRDGLVALRAFMDAVDLPTPTVVNSGYGLHIYWPFTDDVATPTWLRIAERLQNAALHHNLKVDPTVTCDAARILRLPGTWNFKYGAQVPVQIFKIGAPTAPATIVAKLASYKGSAPSVAAPNGNVPAAFQGLPTEDLAANIRPPYGLKGVLTQCPGFMAMFANKGAHCHEPLWKAALDVCHRSSDSMAGRQAIARELSHGHPGFTEEGFQVKWQQTIQQDYEPSTCERFASLGMFECATCPLRQSVKSPVVLGRAQPPVAPAPVEVAPLPITPVAVSALVATGLNTVAVRDGDVSDRIKMISGVPYTAIKNTKDQVTPIGHYKILEAEILKDDHNYQSIIRIKFDRAADGPVWVDFTNVDRADGRTFYTKLLGASLNYRPEDIPRLKDIFLVDFMAQLQQVQKANRLAGRCGWSADNEEFVLGTTVYTKSGTEAGRAAGSHADLVEAFGVKGDEAVWREAFDIALKGGPDRAAVLALAIATPLMKFSGVNGLMVNAYSPESGIGKSTLCEAALSLWGAPKTLMRGKDDTINARFKVAGVFNNLPYVIDECTNMDGRHLSDFVYSLTQGKERGRLNANASMNRDVATWCLPVIATGNNSIHSKLQMNRNSSEAEVARVFELRMRPLDVAPADIATMRGKLAKLEHNYGFFGPRLAALYAKHPAAKWTQILSATIDNWDKSIGTTTRDRFYSTFCALCELGAKIGASFGLAFDVDAIKGELIRQWKYQVREFEEEREDSRDLIIEYYRQHAGSFLLRGTNSRNQDQLALPALPAGRPHRGEQIGSGFGQAFNLTALVIPEAALMEFADEHQYDRRVLKQWLTDEQRTHNSMGCVLQRAPMELFKGTHVAIKVKAVRIDPRLLGIAAQPLLTAVDGGIDEDAGTQ